MSKLISPLSAAVAVRAWADLYGRTPSAREFCPQNGLPHFTTVYHHFPSLSALCQMALGLSAADYAQWEAAAHLAPPVLKERRCLRCDKTIYVQGDLWRCPACRRRCVGMVDETPALSKREMKHFGMEEFR